MSFRMDKDRRKDILNSYCAKIGSDIEGIIRNREGIHFIFIIFYICIYKYYLNYNNDIYNF